MQKVHLLFLILIALLLNSCSDSNNNPTNDLDLGEFSSIVETDKGTYNYLLALGLYAVNQQTTSITISLLDRDDASTSDVIILEFKGNSTGKYNLSNDNTIRMTINSTLYESVSGTGNIEITSYGDVNGTISGKFSGDLKVLQTGETLKIESATFKAKRMINDDDEDDDNDDDNDDDDDDINLGNSTLKIKLKLEDGTDFELNRTNLIGSAVYLNKVLSLQSAFFESEDELFSVAVSIRVEDYDNSNNATFIATADNVETTMLMLTYNGMPHRYQGEFTIVKSAKDIGDYYEIVAAGDFYSLIDQSKVGNISELYIKVYRE